MVNSDPITPEEKEFVGNIEESSIQKDGLKLFGQIPGERENISEEYTWKGQGDEINSEEESADHDNGETTSPVAEILTFDHPEPKPEEKKIPT